MNRQYEPIYYLVYNPRAVKLVLSYGTQPQFYMEHGYYILAWYPERDDDKIVYGGSYRDCINAAIRLSHFSMN